MGSGATGQLTSGRVVAHLSIQIAIVLVSGTVMLEKLHNKSKRSMSALPKPAFSFPFKRTGCREEVMSLGHT